MNIKMKQSYQMKSGGWKIWASQKCVPYNTQTKRLLCSSEKLDYTVYKKHSVLNKRNEIVSKYWHQLKYSWARYDTKDSDDVRLTETTIL